jgi:hypothetical protein
MIDHKSTYSKLFYLLNQGQTHSLERNGGGGGSLLGNVASCGLVLPFFSFLIPDVRGHSFSPEASGACSADGV